MATHIAAVRGTDQTGGSSTTIATASSLTLAVGDVVHAYLSFAQTGASGITATVADGLGNTYTQVFAEPHSSQTDWTVIGFECIVTNAGTATPTATASTGITYRTIHALQGRPGSGNTFATDVDTSAESSSPGTVAQPASAISVVGPGYASAAAAYYSYGTMSSTWGTLVSDTGSIDTAAAYKLISSSGSETPELTSSNGSTWVMGAISTKEVTAGGGSTSLTADPAAYTVTARDVSFSENLGATGNVGGMIVGSSAAFVGEAFVGAGEATGGGGAAPLIADPASYVLTAQAVTLKRGLKLPIAAAAYVWTPSSATVDYGLTASAASFVLNAQDVTFIAGGADPVLTIDAAAYVLTAQAVGLRAGRRMAVTAASYVLTGQDVALRRARRTAIDPAAYSVSGQVVGLRAGRRMSALAASFLVTGQAVTMRSARRMGVVAASYIVSAQDVSLRNDLAVAIDPAAYAVTAQAVALRRDRRMAVTAATYTVAGQDVTFTLAAAGKLTVDPAAYAVTAQPVALRAARRMAVQAAAYVVTAQAVTFARARGMVAAAAAFVVSSQAITTRFARRLIADHAQYLVTGQVLSLIAGVLIAGSRRRIAVSRGSKSLSVQAGGKVFVVKGGRGRHEVG